MPSFTIRSPDGQEFDVDAPDGATENDAMQMVMQHVRAYDAKQRLVPAPPAATEGMSGGQLAAAGAGKAFVDLGRGIGQRAGMVSPQQVAESRQTDAPLLDTGMGRIGNIGGNVMAAAPALMVPGANTVVGSGIVGGLLGAAQPSLSGRETAANIAFGGAGGAAGQRIGQTVGGWVRNQDTALTAAQRAAMGANPRMRLTPGQATGSKALQRAEAAMESNPMTSGPFDALREHNQREVNRAAARAIGETGTDMSAPVLDRAFTRVEDFYDTLNTPRPVRLDQNAITGRLTQMLDNYEGQYVGNHDFTQNALFRNLDRFVQSGTATQAQLSRLASNLGKASRAQMTSASGDRTMGMALGDLKDVVDDALFGALPAAEQQAFREARGHYRTLMQLTGRLGVVNQQGNVSGRALANTLQQSDRRGFMRGQNQSDLYNAARFTSAFPDVVGNSGTATRSLGPTDWLTSLPTAALVRMYMSRPIVAGAQVGVPLIRNAQNALAAGLETGTPLAGITGAAPTANLLMSLLNGQEQ